MDESLKRPEKHCLCSYIQCGFVGLANDVLILNGIGVFRWKYIKILHVMMHSFSN